MAEAERRESCIQHGERMAGMERGLKDLGRGVDEIRADTKELMKTQSAIVTEIKGFNTWAQEKRDEDRCRDTRLRKLEAWRGWLMGAVAVIGVVVAWVARYAIPRVGG